MFRHQLRILLGFAALSLFAFAAYPFALQEMAASARILESYRSALGILILPVIVALVFIANERANRKRWAEVLEARAERDYEIDENGVRAIGETFNSFVTWDHFTHAQVRNGFFYLRTAQNLYYFFPVAIVPDLAALKALAAAKIKPQPASGKWFGGRIWLIWLGIIIIAIMIAMIPNPSPK